MSIELVESIINGDYVSANELFEQRLNDIKEKKLYETKRMVAADMDEAFGGLTKKEIEDRKKKGFLKASDVLNDPRDIKIPLRKKEDKKKKRVSEETLDEAGLAAGAVAARELSKRPIAKKLFKAAMSLRRLGTPSQTSQQSPDHDLRKTFGVEKPGDKKRPGIIRRNVNTLMGRDAGYVKPEKSPEEKEMQRGGKLGKGLRIAGKGVGLAGKGVGKAWGAWGDVLRAGQSGNLEE